MEKKLFQKNHLKQAISCSTITTSATQKYCLSELSDLKESLAAAKSALDPLYKGDLKPMLSMQNAIDTYKKMRKLIEENANAKHVSNAWMKYWEIYIEYDLIPKKDRVLAFFNAELPGASLCAFNHYMKTHNRAFEWFAASLVDANSTALGDSYGLFENNKTNWLMTNKNNGDATVVENLLDFEERIGPKSQSGGVDFFSHDAGMDSTSDYNNQETINMKLHLGCALSGLLTMRVGASFVAKQYTMFETLTWNLIVVYSALFEEFFLCKPLTSRPYNSEVYLVGKNYKGLPAELRSALIAKLRDFDMAPIMTLDSIRVTCPLATAEIIRFAKQVFGQQIAFLKQNVSLFKRYRTNPSILWRELEKDKAAAIEEWLAKYPVARIDDSDQLKSNAT